MKKMLLLVSIVALLLTASCAPAEVPLSGDRAPPAVEPTPQEVPEVIEASVDDATAIDEDLAELDVLDAELAALENLI